MVGSADAWRSADWKRTCRLPFGTFTASEAADINTFDVLVHTWDIAHALDVPFEPLPELTKLAYRIATRLVTPQAVADGHYSRPADGGQAVGPPNWCDVLAMTGRQG